MTGSLLVTCVLAAFIFTVFQGYNDRTPRAPIQRPVARSEPDPAGEAFVEVIGGVASLLGYLVCGLVFLSPLLILAWLVTR